MLRQLEIYILSPRKQDEPKAEKINVYKNYFKGGRRNIVSKLEVEWSPTFLGSIKLT